MLQETCTSPPNSGTETLTSVGEDGVSGPGVGVTVGVAVGVGVGVAVGVGTNVGVGAILAVKYPLQKDHVPCP